MGDRPGRPAFFLCLSAVLPGTRPSHPLVAHSLTSPPPYLDGKSFEYGFNFTECGWLKLIEKEGIKDSAPYACLCDYARMRAIGIGFKRTKTIAAGAEICDFRFIKNYETPKGWPPEDLEENKDFYTELKKKN